MKYFYAAFISLMTCGTSMAAPPPPEILPAKFPKVIEGYDVGTMYNAFVRNLEGVYPELLLNRAKYVEKYNGPRITFYSDWRRNSLLHQFALNCENECRWELHTLKLDGSYFKQMANERFNPAQLVEDLKDANIGPKDIWDYPFWINTRIKQKLINDIKIETITQTQCPNILKSLKVFEGLRMPKIDIEGVGKDSKGDTSWVHATWYEIAIPHIDRKTAHVNETRISGYSPNSYAGELSAKVFKPIKMCFNK